MQLLLWKKIKLLHELEFKRGHKVHPMAFRQKMPWKRVSILIGWRRWSSEKKINNWKAVSQGLFLIGLQLEKFRAEIREPRNKKKICFEKKLALWSHSNNNHVQITTSILLKFVENPMAHWIMQKMHCFCYQSL